MTLCTCFTVFKWENVKSDAGHGTMFMVFFCWFVWSVATLCRTLVVYTNDRIDSLEHLTIRHLTFVTETFFNAISLWFMVAAYEFQRRALCPRNERSHRTCLTWYMLLIGGVSIGILVALLVIEYAGTMVQGVLSANPTKSVALSAVMLTKISWVSWGLRCLAVIYPAAVACWLNLRRDHLKFQGLPKALSLIVFYFLVMNAPYLVVDPLLDVDEFPTVQDKDHAMKLLGIMRTLSYFSGVAISFVMGFSVQGFDAFYNARRSSLTAKSFQLSMSRNSLFVLSDSISRSHSPMI
ncbi:Aste57867_5316 [Aphanomyces stellatus]|uniref:Aste57867_5316 protein n=1 Tax=Aphanomyces stellatus TaxID=120398 RepID=A0A485KEG6_9STRA|nr:hypothetical protein As57867_005303 [Aphanomyces stellatus]VFT82382.1 Aste57867_5316 [Aphanomyces stellatus]